jgi:glycosyltransferase involved in cell wall biosynthesis
MGKKKNYQHLPLVSICTPTFNRRPFINNIIQCYKNQTYPQVRMEWIIIDDGNDKVKDLFQASDIRTLRYFEYDQKMPLGQKRNIMHSHARGDIIVYMDDDDYYPPERVEHAVDMLTNNPQALCAGASEIYVYFKGMDKMIQCGPYGPNHATAGTFAFKKELLLQTKYEDHAAIAEERAFLKDYTIPFVQLDPLKTILVFSHEHNTFDKRKMFEQNQDPRFFKESGKVVNNFIRQKREKPIKQFFMEDIDGLLNQYDFGKPEMKPDVLEQIKEIEANRAKQIEEIKKKQMENGPIVLQKDGQDIQLNNVQVVEIIKTQQTQIKEFIQNKEQMERFTKLLQEKVGELMTTIKDMRKENNELKARVSSLESNTSVSTSSNNSNIELIKEEIQKDVAELATQQTPSPVPAPTVSSTTPIHTTNSAPMSKTVPLAV